MKRRGSKRCCAIPRLRAIWVDGDRSKMHLTDMNAQTKLSAKGQVVIPKDVRDRLGLTEGTVFDVIERAGEVILKRKGSAKAQSGAEAVAAAVREIASFYRYDGPPVSIEDMNSAVIEVVRKKHGRDQRQ